MCDVDKASEARRGEAQAAGAPLITEMMLSVGSEALRSLNYDLWESLSEKDSRRFLSAIYVAMRQSEDSHA